MKVQRCLIYQQASVEEPWALTFEVSKEQRKWKASAELMADWVPNRSKVFRFAETNLNASVKAVAATCKTLGHEMTQADLDQIHNELDYFKKSFE